MERHLTSGAGDAPQVLDDVFLRPTGEPPILDEAAVAAVSAIVSSVDGASLSARKSAIGMTGSSAAVRIAAGMASDASVSPAME